MTAFDGKHSDAALGHEPDVGCSRSMSLYEGRGAARQSTSLKNRRLSTKTVAPRKKEEVSYSRSLDNAEGKHKFVRHRARTSTHEQVYRRLMTPPSSPSVQKYFDDTAGAIQRGCSFLARCTAKHEVEGKTGIRGRGSRLWPHELLDRPHCTGHLVNKDGYQERVERVEAGRCVPRPSRPDHHR